MVEGLHQLTAGQLHNSDRKNEDNEPGKDSGQQHVAAAAPGMKFMLACDRHRQTNCGH